MARRRDSGSRLAAWAFGDVPIAEPEPPRPHHPWQPPEEEFPGLVPVNTLLLGRTEQAAVAITGLSGYSAGFVIFVTARSGRALTAVRGSAGPTRQGIWLRRGGLSASGCSSLTGPGSSASVAATGPDHNSAPLRPILRPFLGGGPRSHFSRWWARPLPPGPLEFVCEWPAFRITGARPGIDGQLILNAVSQSIRP